MSKVDPVSSLYVSYDFGSKFPNFIDVSFKQRNHICLHSKDALENQKRFFRNIGLEKYFDKRVMVAGNATVAVNEIDSFDYSGYSGEVSNCNGFAGIYTSFSNMPLIAGIGDCPWLMVVGNEYIGLVHVGRNLLDANIIKLFFEQFNKVEDTQKVKIGISPYIRGSNFVHETVNFKRGSDWDHAVLDLDDCYFVCLERMIVSDLLRMRIKEENIHNFGVDTWSMSQISSLLNGVEISHRQSVNNEGRSMICLMKQN